MSAWPLVSRVGESALLMPCALVVFAWLQSSRAPHDRANAVRWALTLGCAVALVVASKLAYMGWGIGSRAFDFTGISGHSTMAAAVLPVLARLLVPERHRAMAALAVAASVAIAIVVGVSRLALEVHSPAEVVAGLALGFSASATFLAWSARPLRAAPRVVAGVVLLLALAAPHPSVSLPTHGMLERIASHLAGREAPYRRGEWHDGQGRHEARQERDAALTGDATRCVRHQTDPPARQHDDT
ncbi:phosphatase PAP2 family protein [Cupriavidus sp. 2KB_3]|uniref:phosphatase PAP2 family protein n=1 Tax=Cupriavidus TaxID=106589 RepID=UPI0011EE351F|nr:phosphatase PAP2 family protein [Cupriavidus campinensis]